VIAQDNLDAECAHSQPVHVFLKKAKWEPKDHGGRYRAITDAAFSDSSAPPDSLHAQAGIRRAEKPHVYTNNPLAHL
jgi:hypothetical protein